MFLNVSISLIVLMTGTTLQMMVNVLWKSINKTTGRFMFMNCTMNVDDRFDFYRKVNHEMFATYMVNLLFSSILLTPLLFTGIGSIVL